MGDTGEARRPLKTRSAAWAQRLAAALARSNVTPNQISVASLVFALAGAALLAWYVSPWGLVATAAMIQGRLLCNLLDGMVAMEGGRRSAAGEIYNDLPDRLSDAVILLAAGYSVAWPGFAHELGWSAALLAVMTAYVRTLGCSSGLPQDFRGPMAKPQRMFVMTVACLAACFDTRAIAPALGIIALGSLVTGAARLRRIVQLLERRSSHD